MTKARFFPVRNVRQQRQERANAVAEDVKALPVVVIKNFGTRGSQHEEVLTVLAEWAAGLVENQVRVAAS